MTTLSKILADTAARTLEAEAHAGRDWRAVFPAPTSALGEAVHRELLGAKLRSYLVVASGQPVGPDLHRLHPAGLTSHRVGSFVAIALPGQLSLLQDSIVGSGGALRSLAFPEEWPWIDDGSPQFRFDGPVLEALVNGWSRDTSERRWLTDFVVNGLVPATRTLSDRAHLLIDEILGAFDADRPNDLSVRDRFLLHAGIPTETPTPAVEPFLTRTGELCERVLDRFRLEADIRESIAQRVDEIDRLRTPEQRTQVRHALDVMFDGLATSPRSSSGLLALRGCWSSTRGAAAWRVLHQELLRELFEVEGSAAELRLNEIECPRGVHDRTTRKLATFSTEHFRLKFLHRIPASEFARGGWWIAIQRRRQQVRRQDLTTAEGSTTFELTADEFDAGSKSVALKAILGRHADSIARVAITLHVCSERRPALLVTEPGFVVLDLRAPESDALDPDLVEVDEPVHAYVLTRADSPLTIEDEEGEATSGVQSFEGIWRTPQKVDPAGDPSLRVHKVFRCGDRAASVVFEATEVHSGEFTLEDELRELLASGPEARVGPLLSIFRGESREPYRGLANLTDRSRRRTFLAGLVTSPTGWKPLLADLLGGGLASTVAQRGWVNALGEAPTDDFDGLTLSPEAESRLSTYVDARRQVLRFIESGLDTAGLHLEHPTYASHPLYVHTKCSELEPLLASYLTAYAQILEYVVGSDASVGWSSLFVLTHLDCIIHWAGSLQERGLFVLGPWHPLILAKRYMVQATLHDRAARFVASREGKELRRLCGLLRGTAGLRWLLTVSPDERKLEASYLLPTDDPAWHAAVRVLSSYAGSSFVDATCALTRLGATLGLSAGLTSAYLDELVPLGVTSFARAFPSRRAVSVDVGEGYSPGDVVAGLDALLHGDDGPTATGRVLSGGVSVRVGPSDVPLPAFVTTSPTLLVYGRGSGATNPHSDVQVLDAASRVQFRTESVVLGIPRGTGTGAAFAEPLRTLTEGQSLVPRTITNECDRHTTVGSDLGAAFTRVASAPARLLQTGWVSLTTVSLPSKLQSTWAIAPGLGVDPAVLVKYVKDGSERRAQERALWDYRVEVGGGASSYYILSEVPRSFGLAVGGIFSRDGAAAQMIDDLGRVGIAIGGEALRSGRHAMGVVGLCGAVRAIRRSLEERGEGLQTPLLVIPIDAFATFFGKETSVESTSQQRADLLALRLVFKGDELTIGTYGVEAKCVALTFQPGEAAKAIAQARSTVEEVRRLIRTAAGAGSMPERLALLAIVRFGMRATAAGVTSEAWATFERATYEAILRGRVRLLGGNHFAVAVTTERGLRTHATFTQLDTGGWLRLPVDHWPGVTDTPSLADALARLAAFLEPQPPSSEGGTPPTRPTPGPVPAPEPFQVIRRSQPPTENCAPLELSHTDGAVPPSAAEQVSPGAAEETPSPTPAPVTGGGAIGVHVPRILIGADEAGQPTYFDPQSPVDRLDNMNLMVTGSPGTGKTQFLKYLLSRIRDTGARALLLDFKNDFASDAAFCERADLARIFVTFDGLPFNPLIPYPIKHPATGKLYLQPAQHIAGIAGVFKHTYRLGAQQEYSLKSAIEDAFREAGLDPTGASEHKGDLQYPDLAVVGDRLRVENPLAFNRLSPLFSLGLFRAPAQQLSFESMLQRSLVLDISQIPSDEVKDSIAQLVVLASHAYFNTQFHTGLLRHALVFDEAHRVLGSASLPRLARECRAYGVGLLLSSQFPQDFPDEVSASMATKVVHSNGRDVERVRRIAHLLGLVGQEAVVASLANSWALVDNRHYVHQTTRMMNYPAMLVYEFIRQHPEASVGDLSRVPGVDTNRQPIETILENLQGVGLIQRTGGSIRLAPGFIY